MTSPPFAWPTLMPLPSLSGESDVMHTTGVYPEDYADSGEWEPQQQGIPLPYGSGFVHQPKQSLLERLASTGSNIASGAKQFGKNFIEDLDVLAPNIENRERLYRAANVASFFVPPLKVGMTASLATRMAVKALETGAVTGGLSAIRGSPIVPNAILGGGLGAGIEALLTKGRRIRTGGLASSAVKAFEDSGQGFSNVSTSPLHNQNWAVVGSQLTDRSMLRLPDDINLTRHAKLGDEIRNMGYEPVEVKGYGPNQDENQFEDAWLVPGMKQKHALELAKAHGQGSVLTNDGLVDFNNARVYPLEKSKTLFNDAIEPNAFSTDSPYGKFSLSFASPIDVSTNIANPIGSDTASQIEKLISRSDGQSIMDKVLNLPVKTTMASWYTKLVRSFYGIEQFEKTLGEGGKARADQLNISELAQLAGGHSAYAQHAYEFGIPAWNNRTQIVAPALESIFGRVKPAEWETFEQYGFARRFLHLANDREFKLPEGLSAEGLQEFVNETEEKLPHLSGVFDDYLNWRNVLAGELLKNSKVLGSDAYDAMVQTSKDFVPLRKPFETPEGILGKSKKFIINSPIKDINSIGSKFEPWTHAVIKDLYSWSKLAHNQDIVHELVNKLEEIDPSAAKLFAEKVNVLPAELGAMQKAAIDEIRASDPELAKAAEKTGLDISSLVAPQKAFASGYVGTFVPKVGFKTAEGEFISHSDAADLIEAGTHQIGAEDRIQSPAVQIGDKVVSGSSHAEAIRNAIKDAAENNTQMPNLVPSELGYATKSGKFVSGEEATDLVRGYAGPKLTEELNRRASLGLPGIDSSDIIEHANEFKPELKSLEPYNGLERAWYKITDPNLWEAFQSMKPAEMGVLTKLFAGVASTLRAGATLSLEFMVRNPLKDIPHAGVTTGTKPFSAATGFAHVLRRDEVYQNYLASGGGRASLIAQDRASIKTHIADTIGLDETKGIGKIYNVIKSPIEGLQALSDFLETGTRVGVYDQRYQELLRNGLAPAEATRLAALSSRNATVDFGVHGSRTNSVRIMTAFWNANIQGYDNLVRSFKANPTGAAMRATAMITLPSTLLYLQNRNDPEYLQLPSWERDMFWHVKMPESMPWVGDKWMRFPKPFDLGYIFGSSVERFLQFLDGNDKGTVDALAYNYLSKNIGDLIPIPTVAKPIIENLMNRSLLRNRPIESRGMEDIAPEYRIQPGTSAFAQALGKRLGSSPVKIDNLIRGYFGGLGKVGTDLGDAAININAGKPILPHDGFFDPRDVPGLRGLFSQFPRQNEDVDKLYQVADQIREAEYTRSHLRKTMQVDDWTNWMEQKNLLIGMSKPIGNLLKQMQSLRQMRDMILRDKTMSSNERADQLDTVSRAMLSIASAAEPFEELVKEKP